MEESELIELAGAMKLLCREANEWGDRYRAAKTAGETEKMVGSAVCFLVAVGNAIPNLDENNSAHVLIANLMTALQHSAHGKKHPLLRRLSPEQKVAGVGQRGIPMESISSVTAGAVLFLEAQNVGTDDACRHVSKLLTAKVKIDGRPVRAGPKTVKNWLDEQSLLELPRSESRRFVGLSIGSHTDRATRDFKASEGVRGRDPLKFMEKWLPEQCQGILELLGV